MEQLNELTTGYLSGSHIVAFIIGIAAGYTLRQAIVMWKKK